MSTRQKILHLLAGVVSVLVLAGCSGQHQDGGENWKPNVVMNDELQRQLDAYWREATLTAPKATRPEVAVEEVVNPAVQMEKVAKCLNENGFPEASAYPDGSLDSGLVANGQQEQFAITQYTCFARFPAPPETSAKPSDDLIRAMYDYDTGDYRACLEKLGATISDPPSFEVYAEDIRNANQGQWSPQVEASKQLDRDTRSKLATLCPPNPPGYWDKIVDKWNGR